MDNSDNHVCGQCQEIYSNWFPRCPHCCPHAVINFTEEVADHGWCYLVAHCARCGEKIDGQAVELYYQAVKK